MMRRGKVKLEAACNRSVRGVDVKDLIAEEDITHQSILLQAESQIIRDCHWQCELFYRVENYTGEIRNLFAFPSVKGVSL